MSIGANRPDEWEEDGSSDGGEVDEAAVEEFMRRLTRGSRQSGERMANRIAGFVVLAVGFGLIGLGYILTKNTARFWYGAYLVGGFICLKGLWMLVSGKKVDH